MDTAPKHLAGAEPTPEFAAELLGAAMAGLGLDWVHKAGGGEWLELDEVHYIVLRILTDLRERGMLRDAVDAMAGTRIRWATDRHFATYHALPDGAKEAFCGHKSTTWSQRWCIKPGRFTVACPGCVAALDATTGTE